MRAQEALGDLRLYLVRRYATASEVQRVLWLAGLDLDGLSLHGSPAVLWRRALDACHLQGPEALESLLVEIQCADPGYKTPELLLGYLARGELDAPAAAEGGGSITESIVRDPIEGAELLLAYVEARGDRPTVAVQLRRCLEVLQSIKHERRRHGRTLAREVIWKRTVHEILDLAHSLEDPDSG